LAPWSTLGEGLTKAKRVRFGRKPKLATHQAKRLKRRDAVRRTTPGNKARTLPMPGIASLRSSLHKPCVDWALPPMPEHTH